MLLQAVLLVFSIVLLYYGAEFVLHAAEKIGLYLGLSPLVIGLLIVGFGTSLPEFFVSQLASYRGESGIALGNIVGSNIANLFLILGVSGTMTTLHILRRDIKAQFVLHLILTVLLSITLMQDSLKWWSVLMLGSFFAFYMWHTFKEMSKQKNLARIEKQLEEEIHEDIHNVHIAPTDWVKLIIGFVLLFAGGELLVKSGSELGRLAGISTYVISAVFVAFGTSFPEFITAILACVKKKDTDIITGNIIGSNIFNVAFVLTSLGFYNVPIEKSFAPEIIVLLFASIFLLGLTFIRKNFALPAGVIFLLTYAGIVYSWV
ncbi:K+-dependent Na+/Ca+ exchanger family protein [Bacteriovorax sp. BSW11_IV]|uniref:calcium/sodium antiporter n=1 Tax=Bacteriovorax sp. BSW11_IV TaxID=1353529 RepID=UPI00038A30EE|nr:calcium/sodium antiporter [Bacteriovorax sp. BSW11_IV]EQC46735.1 K+-dependent Na+/Ca+ exchanger family protein [Bacteriovorax sp. BSW11_IV]